MAQAQKLHRYSDEHAEDPKLKVIQRLEKRINSTLEDEESKLNMRAYKYLLENGALDDHEGRYAVFHHGLVFDDTFESGDSFLNYSNFNNTTDSYTLYKIPGISVKPAIQMYHRTEVQLSLKTDSCDSALVPITFNCKTATEGKTTYFIHLIFPLAIVF